MNRSLVYAWVLLAIAGSHCFAQSPRIPPQSPPRGFVDELQREAEDAPVRRRLAEPLRNQFDRFGRQQAEDELQADVVTPEMWLYMQEMRRYDDPLQAVRRNAATRATHRRARIAAMQWFGFSNIRPQASPIPFSDVYSPTWTSNSWNPYTWTGAGNPWTAVRVEPIVITR
jgi:hypothetical protein